MTDDPMAEFTRRLFGRTDHNPDRAPTDERAEGSQPGDMRAFVNALFQHARNQT